MGRAAVRQAVTSFIQGAGIPYVGSVYPARTYIVDMTDYTALTGSSPNGSDAIVMVNIPSDKRTRVADVGRGAVDDTNIHPIALEIFFGSSAGDPVAAQEDYDQIIDAFFIAVRNNPTLGNGTVIWSAGEFAAGVRHAQSEPFTDENGLTVMINGVIEFEAWEWPAGSDV
jgi:hypothetical protein